MAGGRGENTAGAGGSITVRAARAGEWREVRALRLAALADAPYAFEETLAGARAMPDEEWRRRSDENAAGVASVCAMALDGERPVGMAVGVRDTDEPARAFLFAMWVAPAHRGTGTAARLVRFVADWARAAGATVLASAVTEHNPRAQAFYRRLGFTFLDERHPWPPDPTRSEIPMRLDL